MVFRVCATPIAHGVGSYEIPAAISSGALPEGAHPLCAMVFGACATPIAHGVGSYENL